MDDKQVSKNGRCKTFPVGELQCRDEMQLANSTVAASQRKKIWNL
jgi:hypothetical protein